MNNFLNKLQRFLYGRNGLDRFSIALAVFYFITSIICSFFKNPIIRLIPLLPLGYLVFRFLSKNLTARRRENDWYIRVFGGFAGRVKTTYARLSDTTHKYYRCPNCRQRIRVPKFKGKIEICCPKCGTKFIRNTGK